jgi:hypothetical protein
MGHLSYNFHDLATVQITSADPVAKKFFEEEYGSSGATLSRNNRIVDLHWSKDLALYSPSSDFQFHAHKILARWSYRLNLQSDSVNIEALGNRMAIPMVHHMLVHPSLRYLCAKTNTLMLHGSAVSMNDRSLVFTGMGGTGKTTISSLLLLHGGIDWSLHADDYVFLAKGPTSFSYMTRSHLYRDHLRWVPEIKSILTPYERIRLEVLGRLRQFTREGIKWPLRVNATRLWPNHTIAPIADLAAILILGQERADSLNISRLQPTDEIIEDLLEMNFYEARHFIQLVEKSFKGLGFSDWLETWKESEQRLLTQLLHETSLFRLDLPFISEDLRGFGQQLVDLLRPIVEAGGLDG